MPDLSYNDKKSALAQALGISTYSVRDFTDKIVIYYDDKAEKTYGRAYSVADGKLKFEMPQAYLSRTVWEPVTSLAAFSMDDATVEFAGDEVIYTGKVFEAGNYPDKNFSLTEAEMTAAAADFSPVSNDLEHKNTILDGKIGQLRSVVARGKDLIGTVAVPKWLYNAVGKGPIKTSLAWNTATKRIVGNGLVLNPRVKDAQLVAAFNESQGLDTGGNTVPNENKTGKKPKWYESLAALFTKKQLPEGMEDFDPEKVSFADEPETSPQPPAPQPAQAPVQDNSQTAQFAAELQQERDVNTGLSAALLKRDAAAFFDDALKAGKVFPAERESLIAQFTQAVRDDNAGKACFSADGSLQEGVRVKALRDGITARPSHGLTSEQLSGIEPENLVVLSANTTTGGQMTAERRKQLIDAGSIKPKEVK